MINNTGRHETNEFYMTIESYEVFYNYTNNSVEMNKVYLDGEQILGTSSLSMDVFLKLVTKIHELHFNKSLAVNDYSEENEVI